MKRRIRLSPPVVNVQRSQETVDVQAFARQVVAVALELEGITPPPVTEAERN